MGTWTLDDIPWDRFDPSKARSRDPAQLIKAASLVEHNGGDYATYLCRVFADDPEFAAIATRWGAEEIQHGKALGRWAQLADPAAISTPPSRASRAGYQAAARCRRHRCAAARAGEMMARCIVETGTSSYYSALKRRGRRAGAEADLPPRSPPTSSATTSSSTRTCGAIWSASGSAAGAGCASAGAASPRARTTSSPTPITPPTNRGRALRPPAQHARLCPPRLSAVPRRTTSSARWRWC